MIISNDTLLSVTGLRPYRTYICTIAASTSVGLGPYSVSLTVNTLEDGKASTCEDTIALAIVSSYVLCLRDTIASSCNILQHPIAQYHFRIRILKVASLSQKRFRW